MKCPEITKHNRKQINKRHPQPKPTLPFTATTDFTCRQCYAQTCCRGLCPPMEWLIQQVEVEPSREVPTIDPMSIVDKLKSMPWASNLSTSQNIAIMFFFEEFSQPIIADKLKLSRQYVNRVILNYRERLNGNTLK